ncbi:MAG: RNA pyrophosphohydrolase [Pseudomonadota bacterium]|jgi:putative (di)nucleoside polyphosphate hydrolase
MTDVIDRDGFRANVGIVLMGENGKLFLGRRTGGKGWQFPQGGMRRGESAEESLYRELHEEVGLAPKDVRLLGSTTRWLRYRLPVRYQRRGEKPLCVGQKQRWFLLQLSADESDIRLDATGEPEFDRWRWVDYWQPVKEVIYFKRPVYVKALHELAPLARPEGLPPYPAWWARHTRQRRRPGYRPQGGQAGPKAGAAPGAGGGPAAGAGTAAGE